MWTTQHPQLRRSALFAGAASLLPVLLGVQGGPAHAFGTTNSLGQHAEHERITRAALACPPGKPSDGSCFEPRSMDQLAGHTGTFGAVGSPDSDAALVPEAHCDNADYLARSDYPRTRQQATDQLIACVSALQSRFAQGIGAAAGTLGSDGKVAPAEVGLTTDCTFTLGAPGRGKCNGIEGFGRALHGVQDFYAHSNWTDKPDPGRPIGTGNPPASTSPCLLPSSASPPAGHPRPPRSPQTCPPAVSHSPPTARAASTTPP